MDDLKLELSISPGRVGQNTFTLKAITAEGHPLHSAKKVLLRFTPTQGDIAPSELELIGLGDGSFVAKGAYLSLPGRWQVQAVVRRADKFDAYANFDFALRNPGVASEATSSIPKQAAWLLLLIGLLCSSLTSSIKAPPGLRLGVGAPLALLTFSLGLFYLTRPAVIETVQVNPIAPNSESIAAGQLLFSASCVPCHGVEGKGDGPVGLTLKSTTGRSSSACYSRYSHGCAVIRMDHKRLSRLAHARFQETAFRFGPLEFGKLYPYTGTQISKKRREY